MHKAQLNPKTARGLGMYTFLHVPEHTETERACTVYTEQMKHFELVKNRKWSIK